MNVPFPKIHIAESVLNRVLNALEGNSALSLNPVPAIPDSTALGAQLDTQLSTPVPPVSMPADGLPPPTAGAVGNTLIGGSPFDGALLGEFA